jgi:hypothetical protein
MIEDYVQLKLKLNKSVAVAFYNETIKPLIDNLKKHLLVQNILVQILRVVLMTSIILTALYLFNGKMRAGLGLKIFMPLLTLVVGYIYWKLELFLKFNNDEFDKKLVVSTFNSILNKKLECTDEFDENHKKYILDSYLLGANISKINTEVLSLGKVLSNSYVFSKVEGYQVINSSSAKEEEVFSGYIIRIKKKERLTGHTLIYQNSNQNKLGALLGKKLQNLNTKDYKAVKFQNENFSKHFIVFSDNFEEIKKNLNSEVIELIIEIQKTYSDDIRISFFEGEILFAIGIKKRSLEFKMDDRAQHISEINRIYNIISAIDHIVYKVQS